MRLRFILLPLLIAASGACRSTDPQPEPEWVQEEGPPGFQDEPREPGVALAAPASARQDTSPFVGDEGLVQRRRQQRDHLVGEYLGQGERALDRADFETALVAFSTALQLDPGNQQARERLQRVESLMGDRYTVAADYLQDGTEREIVRRAQARMSAERAARLGDVALRQGEYARAIEHYREAQLILSYHPLIADDTLDERIVRGKLEEAAALAEQGRREGEQRVAEQARRAAEARERLERERRELKLVTLYEDAHAAFLAERYRQAEQITEQILVEDPGNPVALELRAIARDARHQRTQRDNRRDYREQWQRTFEDLSTMDVPQVEALVFDDLERWKETLGRKPIEQVSVADAFGDTERDVVMMRLEQTRISRISFGGEDGEGTPLVDVAAFLQSVTGINFLVSQKVREDLDEDDTMVTLELPERSVRKILDLISEMSEVRWKVEDGVVKFVTREELRGGQVLKQYEVRDLIQPIPSFPAREINIEPSGGLFLADEDIQDREANVVTSDLLDDLIRNNIAPESWDEDEANSLRITDMGVMVVNQTPEVHAQISQLLNDLRQATGIMVDIQARFLSVADNFLEDIGVDFRGLGQPGPGTNEFFDDFGDATTQGELGREIGTGTDSGVFRDEGSNGDLKARVQNLYDEMLGDPSTIQRSGGLSFQWTYLGDLQLQLILRAVQKSERIELVSAPRILVSNSGRANLSVLNQVTYVKDFDVEIAQAASIADPIVDVVQDGVILDVRPVVSADRRFITLELRPTIATLRRPIREAITTLGSQNAVTIQLPELDIQKVRTSIPMPDGATVLLGGLKISEKRDIRSGTPFLNKIPLVSMLFERKGTYNSNRKLNILLRANIIIPRELEPPLPMLGF